MSDLEGGHQDIVSSIQCLEYDLDFDKQGTLENGRELINKAFSNIKEPIRVNIYLNLLKLNTFSRLSSATKYVMTVGKREMKGSYRTFVTKPK